MGSSRAVGSSITVKRVFAGISTFLLVAAGVFVLEGAPASAAPAGAAEVTIVGDDYIQHDFGGGRIRGWASNGFLDEHPKLAKRLHYPRPPAGEPAPQSAFICSVDVCIDVPGDNEIIYEWGTQAFGNVGCQYAVFDWSPGSVYYGDDICPPGLEDGVYYDYTGPTGYFPAGTILCNGWTVSLGYPCAESR